MENIIARQINNYLVSNNFLSDRQSSFMKVRNCNTALVDVVDDLRLNFDENYLAFLVLLDHTKDFDTVDHEIFLKKLQALFHFSNSAYGLIRSYLMNRLQQVYLNGKHLRFAKRWNIYSSGINIRASVYTLTTNQMFWIIIAYIYTVMTFSFKGALALRISNYV